MVLLKVGRRSIPPTPFHFSPKTAFPPPSQQGARPFFEHRIMAKPMQTSKSTKSTPTKQTARKSTGGKAKKPGKFRVRRELLSLP